MAASMPSEVVVLPSFWRVAAMKIRGVSQFIRGTQGAALFTGKFLKLFCVKNLIRGRLNTNDCGDPENIMGGRTARDVSRRPIQAQQDLAVSIRARNVLNQFAANVSRIKVRKNKHVGTSANFAIGQFSRG